MDRFSIAVGRTPDPGLEAALELAEAAEAAGFTFVTSGDAEVESFSLLGAIATRTSRIGVLSAVSTWTRTPVTTALAAATLAELSGGRFRLGLGPMPRDWSRNWHEVDYARPVERMRDFIAAIRAALRARPDAPASHEGPFYRFRDYPRKLLRDGLSVPIYLGVLRPRMTALAGEVADGILLDVQNTVDWLREVTWPALEEGLERGGRDRADLDVGVAVLCVIDDDPAVAFELARPGVAFFLELPYFADVVERHGFGADLERHRAAAARGDAAAMAAAPSDGLVDLLTLTGTPAQVRAKLGRYDGLADYLQIAVVRGHPVEVQLEQTRRIFQTFAAPAQGT